MRFAPTPWNVDEGATGPRRPHLEYLHPAVLRILRQLRDLLLEVQHLPLQVPAHSYEVQRGRGPSQHESFCFTGKSDEVAPLLEPGVPGPPQENREGQCHPRRARGLPAWGTCAAREGKGVLRVPEEEDPWEHSAALATLSLILGTRKSEADQTPGAINSGA